MNRASAGTASSLTSSLPAGARPATRSGRCTAGRRRTGSRPSPERAPACRRPGPRAAGAIPRRPSPARWRRSAPGTPRSRRSRPRPPRGSHWRCGPAPERCRTPRCPAYPAAASLTSRRWGSAARRATHCLVRPVRGPPPDQLPAIATNSIPGARRRWAPPRTR
jgi:hypothetical protein